MSEVFYHSVIHGLGLFIRLIYDIDLRAQSNKTRFFFVLFKQ